MPNLKDLPMADIAEATKQMLLRDGYKALQYGNGKGPAAASRAAH